MKSMFQDCSSLNVLNIRGFDTTLVTDMSSMFLNCKLINDMDLSHFKTPNLE